MAIVRTTRELPVIPVINTHGQETVRVELTAADSEMRSGVMSPGLWKSALGWGLIAILFLAMRLPVIYCQPGGQDEDCYAVPGITILRTGYPQLPHLPARNPESVYYRADEMLYCEPPLYFYWQAAFYAILPDVYGTARLSSVIAGLGLLFAFHRLSRLAGVSTSASLIATGLLSLSRWFYFPATCARPDILCAMLGVASVLTFWSYRTTGRRRWLLTAGVCLGLGGLTHPFAIVFAIQLAVWTIWSASGLRRIRDLATLTGIALAVFALWLPFILKHPEIFQVQMRNQFGSGHQDSIVWRLLMPWSSLKYHAITMWNHIGALQFSVIAIGLIWSTLASWRGRIPAIWTLCCLIWSSIYLLSVAVGTHHIVSGYWVYPAALAFVPLGYRVGQGQSKIPRLSIRVLGILSLISMMVPGSGIRSIVAYVQRSVDIRYNEPAFARQLIDSLPREAVIIVDTQFALDFVVAGRKVLLSQTLPMYMPVAEFQYDFLVVSRFGENSQLAQTLQGELIRTEGVPEDLFACVAWIYQSSPARKTTRRYEEIDRDDGNTIPP